MIPLTIYENGQKRDAGIGGGWVQEAARRMGGRESATLEKNYDNRSRMAHRGMQYHACYRARHPFERTPSMTKKKRGDAAVEDEQSSLFQSSASGDGLDEEM